MPEYYSRGSGRCTEFIISGKNTIVNDPFLYQYVTKVIVCFPFCLQRGNGILDTQVIGSGSVLRTAVIFFYISNEGVSLIENAAHLGLPIPEKLKSVLEQLHDRAGKEEDHE